MLWEQERKRKEHMKDSVVGQLPLRLHAVRRLNSLRL